MTIKCSQLWTTWTASLILLSQRLILRVWERVLEFQTVPRTLASLSVSLGLPQLTMLMPMTTAATLRTLRMMMNHLIMAVAFSRPQKRSYQLLPAGISFWLRVNSADCLLCFGLYSQYGPFCQEYALKEKSWQQQRHSSRQTQLELWSLL